MPNEIEKLYVEVLEACVNGKYHEGIKLLYQMPYRDQVDWTKFPSWAVPNAEIGGCHEG